jgi:ribonucleotide monophosphatase NagD (HAD superfamily)
LAWALREADLEPVSAADDAVAVASGFGPDVRWRDIMQVAMRVRDGLPWVACNTDATFPTSEGIAPGHGVLVETVSRFSGVSPEVAGKPAAPLLDETIRRTRATRPLMVGDRLDTDIEGARRAGVASLLVLTGVTDLPALLAAPPAQRPNYLAPDLGGLVAPHPGVVRAAGETRVAGWSVTTAGDRLVVAGDGGIPDWWRAVAEAAWWHLDRTGQVVDPAGLAVPRGDGPDR